jgi:hypothetical protein
MSIPCFFLERTDRANAYLRRYVSAESAPKCPGKFSYHNAQAFIGELPMTRDANGYLESISPDKYADDPRWPAKCEACGYEFGLMDEFQVFREEIYRRVDNGAEMTLREAPAGAIWNAFWLADAPCWRGPDGMALICRLPGMIDWHIDGVASNCDSPCKNCGKPMFLHNTKSQIEGQPNAANCREYEDAHPHKCWIRSGTPPNVSVGKGTAGQSCGAGAGSIAVPGWHGFLRNGALVSC